MFWGEGRGSASRIQETQAAGSDQSAEAGVANVPPLLHPLERWFLC